jgi:hypothetical protein
MSNRRTVAMVVNDDAGCLVACGVLWFIASRLAPTLDWHSREWLVGYKAAFASKAGSYRGKCVRLPIGPPRFAFSSSCPLDRSAAAAVGASMLRAAFRRWSSTMTRGTW